MKVTVEAPAFAKALGMAGRVVSRYPSTPIMNAVYLRTGEEGLEIAATNGELSISLKCPASTVEPGELAVPAKMLSEITSSMNTNEVQLSGTTNDAHLTSANSSYTLRAYDPTDFPAVARFPTEAGRSFRIPSKDFADALSTVLVAVSKDEQRPVLSGALATFEKDRATLVGTDAYRLCLRWMYLEEGPEQPQGAIIPAGALKEAARLSTVSEVVAVALTENAAMFAAGSVVFTTRLVEGAFPEYERLLPQSFATEVTVDAQALKESLKRVNLFAGRQSFAVPVKLAFFSAADTQRDQDTLSARASDRRGTLTVSVDSAETGAATEVLDASVPEGVDLAMAFNGVFLADGIDALIRSGSGDVVLKANEPLQPAVLSTGAVAETPAETANGTPGKAGSSWKSGAGESAAGGVADGTDQNPVHTGDHNDEQAPGISYLLMPMRDPRQKSG